MPDDLGPEGGRTGADIAKAALAKARDAAAARRREQEGSAAARRRAQNRAANARPPRPAADDPTPVGTAIEELLADRGWQGEATVAAVTADWAATVGPELAAHCEPVSLRAGVLTVAAESTAWATQIRLLSAQLVARIAERAGEGVVRSVVVRGPVAPSWTHGPRRVRGRGPRDTYG